MRSTGQRKSDAIDKLEKDQDVWVATADERGIAHLVPLSLCWHDGKAVVAVEGRSRRAGSRSCPRPGGTRPLNSSRKARSVTRRTITGPTPPSCRVNAAATSSRP